MGVSFSFDDTFPKKDSFFSGMYLITLATVCESSEFYESKEKKKKKNLNPNVK